MNLVKTIISLSLFNKIELIAITLVVFALIDFIWLGKIAKPIYQKYIGQLILVKPNLLAAILFYIIYAIGLNIFVILNNVQNQNFSQLLWQSALFGFVGYSIFDLTNKSVLKNWPTAITIIDLAWGTILTSLVSVILYELAIIIFK